MKRKIKLYGMSDSLWTIKAKELLEKAGIDFQYIAIDELKVGKKRRLLENLEKKGLGSSFPIIVFGDKLVIGYDEERLRKLIRYYEKKR